MNNLNNIEFVTEFTATYYYLDGTKRVPLDCVSIWALDLQEAHETAFKVAETDMQAYCSKRNMVMANVMTLEEAV